MTEADFERFDTNCDGTISREEIAAGIERHQCVHLSTTQLVRTKPAHASPAHNAALANHNEIERCPPIFVELSSISCHVLRITCFACTLAGLDYGTSGQGRRWLSFVGRVSNHRRTRQSRTVYVKPHWTFRIRLGHEIDASVCWSKVGLA